MNLSTVLILVGVLACPIVMGAMMWMMSRQNMDGGQGHPMSNRASQAERLSALLEQRRLLEQEIAEAEKIANLEARKEALTHDQRPDCGEQPVPATSARKN